MPVRLKSVQLEKNFVEKIESSTGVDSATKTKAEALKTWAITYFDQQVRHTHPVTEPPYRASFGVQKKPRKGWIVINTDPQAVLVEFGSHPGGGSTETLGYRPMGKAIDAVSK